ELSTFSLATKALLDGIGSATNPQHIEQLENRIHALQREICTLKSGQNMFPIINRLPPEILGMVFECYVRSNIGRNVSRLYARWSARECISAVCCHWREVAINHWPLWSRLSFHCAPNYIEIMLARSSGAPLDIEFN
ncbi:hypothetical protein DFP72DRAFT_763915, partial [Ephemerocybe angulata]